MNVSLPDAMKAFIDEQVAQKGYGSSSEYIRDLVRREQDRETLRGLLLDGLNSGPGQVADAAWFAEVRQGVRARAHKGSAQAKETTKRRAGSRTR